MPTVGDIFDIDGTQCINYGCRTYRIFTVDHDTQRSALEIAIKRRLFHKSYGSEKNWGHWIDDKKGFFDDEFWGVLGEMAFDNILKSTEFYPYCQFSTLFTLDVKKLPRWDLKIEPCYRKGVLHSPVEFDIKTIPPDDNLVRRLLLIKKSEFKKVDYYTAVKFLDKGHCFVCGSISGDAVEKLHVVGPPKFFSESYCTELTNLRTGRDFMIPTNDRVAIEELMAT